MITNIKLCGVLGEEFVKELQLSVNSVHEAMWALQQIYPRFKSWVLEQGSHGLAYEVFIGDWQIEEKHLSVATGGQQITVVPKIAASGGNLLKLVAGIALVGLSFTGVGLLGLSSTSLLLAGGALILSGITGMLQPKNKDESGNPNSLVFGNSSEVTRVGAAKRLVFGLHLTEGTVISARVRTYALA